MNFPGFAAEQSLYLTHKSFYSANDGAEFAPGEVRPAKVACAIACMYACTNAGGDGEGCQAACAEICRGVKGWAYQTQF